MLTCGIGGYYIAVLCKRSATSEKRLKTSSICFIISESGFHFTEEAETKEASDLQK